MTGGEDFVRTKNLLYADRLAQTGMRRSWRRALARTLLGTLGGFVLALSFFAALSGSLTALIGVPRIDAAVTAGLLAFLVWTIAALAAFTARSVGLTGVWVFGSSAALALIGWVSIHHTAILA